MRKNTPDEKNHEEATKGKEEFWRSPGTGESGLEQHTMTDQEVPVLVEDLANNENLGHVTAAARVRPAIPMACCGGAGEDAETDLRGRLQLCAVTGPVVQPSLQGLFRGGDGAAAALARAERRRRGSAWRRGS